MTDMDEACELRRLLQEARAEIARLNGWCAATGLARETEDLLRTRRLRDLLKYVSHSGCARNALGGAMVDCTCGLDRVLAGISE